MRAKSEQGALKLSGQVLCESHKDEVLVLNTILPVSA